MTDTLELVSENKSFGGWLRRYRHRSEVLDCDMVFGIYLPPQAETQSVPLVWWLSGLTWHGRELHAEGGRPAGGGGTGHGDRLPGHQPAWHGPARRARQLRFRFGRGVLCGCD